MPLVNYNDKYLSYSNKLASYEEAVPYIPDSVLLSTESFEALAQAYDNYAVCTVTSSINGVASDWTAAVSSGAFFGLDAGQGASGTSLYISISQNTGTNPRQGTIDVSCGDAMTQLAICQDGTMLLCSDL